MQQLQKLIEPGHITDPATPRGKLLARSARLFQEKGYERTTVRDIARDAGIQSGSIFHHFSSKEAILHAVMLEAIVYFVEKLREAVALTSTPEARVLACIRSELQFTIGADTLVAMSVLISEWRCLSEPHQNEILKYRRVYEDVWMETLKQAKAANLLDGDVFIVRRLLAGAINWTTNWYHPDGVLNLEQLVRETFNLACKSSAAP